MGFLGTPTRPSDRMGCSRFRPAAWRHEEFERLGLPAHVETPRDGRHIYVKHPGWPVPSINQPGPEGFKGMEVLGDKHLVTFYSKLPDYPYTLHSRPLVRLDQLTNGLGKVLSSPQRRGKVKVKRKLSADKPLPRPVQVMLEKLGDTVVGRLGPVSGKVSAPFHDEDGA